MKAVTIGNRQLSYAEGGGGPPLLLIHGFPLDHGMWAPQIATFGGVRRVLAPDLYGFGDSAGPGHDSLDLHADDLAAFLDALHVEHAIVAGLSMGGYVAFSFWRRHRARVAALILADTRAGADTPEAAEGRRATAAVVEKDGTAPVVAGMAPKLTGSHATPELNAEIVAMMELQPSPGVAAALRAMAARPDSTPTLASIDVPTLVLVGAEDVVTPVAESEKLVEGIAGASLVVIPRAGHLANLEEPGAFNGAVREFLTAVDARARP